MCFHATVLEARRRSNNPFISTAISGEKLLKSGSRSPIKMRAKISPSMRSSGGAVGWWANCCMVRNNCTSRLRSPRTARSMYTKSCSKLTSRSSTGNSFMDFRYSILGSKLICNAYMRRTLCGAHSAAHTGCLTEIERFDCIFGEVVVK